MNEQTPDPKAQFGPVQFPTTQLTDVVNVDQDPERAEQAMRKLCERYYVAIEAWFRMKQPDLATDLAHDFIKRWLSRNRLLHFKQKKGIRFRFYLARCLGNFLKDYLRGKEHPTISIEDLSNTGNEISDKTEASPPLLDCQIACAVHQRTMNILRTEAKAKKNHDPRLFESLCGFVPYDQSDASYEQLARDFKIRVGTLRAKVCHLRDDYFIAFRSEVREMTINGRSDADEETQYLLLLLPKAFEQFNTESGNAP